MAQLFMLLAVALTHLEDPDNARQAYEQAAQLDGKDPMISLNFSVFLYNLGDKRGAQKQFSGFETKIKNLKGNANPANTDPEVQEVANKLAAALQVGENLVWKDKPEAKPGPSKENTAPKQPTDSPSQIKEPEPNRPEPTPTPGFGRPVTTTNLDTDIPPTPDVPETPLPNFPPSRDDIPETPLPDLPPGMEEPDRPPPTPTFHPPPGEPMLQKRGVDMSSLPSPFGKSVPPLPFKLGGSKLPPVSGQGQSPNLDNLPSPPDDELPTYEEVEMADKLSGKKKKKKEPVAELEPL